MSLRLEAIKLLVPKKTLTQEKISRKVNENIEKRRNEYHFPPTQLRSESEFQIQT
jgi:hypothetical protein